MGRDLGKFFPPVKTGADGHFRLEGIGRERVVVLRLQGAGIAATELFVLTRPGETVRVGSWRSGELAQQMTFCGSTFEHIAAPCQPIVGIVRDKDTGKPLAGAVVRSYGAWRRNRDGFRFKPGLTETLTYLSAVTDKEGRYRLDSIPKGEGNEIRAEGPEDEPYVMSLASVPQGVGLDPITVDFQLKRGVWVHGKVTDKETGKPVPSVIHCGVFDDNPYRKEAHGLHFEHLMWNHAGDGTFRLATLPGRGVLAAQAVRPHYLSYRFKVGADRIEGLDRHVQLRLNLEPYHTVVEINPNEDARDVRCDIALDPGPTLGGTVLGPDGQPLVGVKAGGLAREATGTTSLCARPSSPCGRCAERNAPLAIRPCREAPGRLADAEGRRQGAAYGHAQAGWHAQRTLCQAGRQAVGRRGRDVQRTQADYRRVHGARA